MPPKIVLILALVIAAAVLVPLRRARKAFPVYSEAAGIVAAPRISMRRRPAGPRVVLRIPGTLERQNLSETPAVASGVVDTAPRSPGGLKADAPACKSTPAGPVSVIPCPPAKGVDGDGGDESVDRVARVVRLAPVDAPGPDPSAAVPVGPAREVALPPPKHA